MSNLRQSLVKVDKEIEALTKALFEIELACDDDSFFIADGLEQTQWIPVSERLPEDTYPVNITWVNHDPEPYYATIKDKPFTATGCYCDGKWYWYSVTCQDYLDEYGHCDVDAMDEAIEVIAWMPLPEPYKAKSEEDNAKSEVEVCSSNFIQLKQDVLNNKQLWQKLREIEDEDEEKDE